MRGLLPTLLAAGLLWCAAHLHAAEQTALPHGVQLHSLREDANVAALGVLDSYAEAVELEKEIAQMYREIRAARLSRIQGQSMLRSLEQTLLPISSRYAPDGAVLSSTAAHADDVTRYQEELANVMRENDAIVANANEMLLALLPEPMDDPPEDISEELRQLLEEMNQEVEASADQWSPDEIGEQVQAFETEAGEKVEEVRASLGGALEEMRQAESVVQSRRESDAEDQDKADRQAEHAKQLAGAREWIEAAIASVTGEKETLQEKMEQAEEALGAISGALTAGVAVDETLKEARQFEPQHHTEEAVLYLREALEDMEATSEILALATELSTMAQGRAGGAEAKQIAQQQALEALSQAAAGTYLDLTKQMKGQDLNLAPEPVRPEDRPPPISRYFRRLSGRKLVADGGTPGVWFSVGQWYILGPYDNQGRMNLQRVYPPESIIDLDAQYSGKQGATLVWEYDSFAEEMVNPSSGWSEYSIYYGYTELFFEDATDAWIAVGSDDRSDLWINDMPVWQSSNELKSWRADEGYRRVHFQKGVNRILFRLENGWKVVGFSLLVNTHNPASPGGP